MSIVGRALQHLAAASRVRSNAIVGNVDAVDLGQVRGWAYAKRQPARRVRLKVLVDGHLVADGVADIYRADLVTAGYGDGCCGFRIDLPPRALLGGQHVVEVFDAEETTRLAKMTRDFEATAVPEFRSTDVLFDGNFYMHQAGSVAGPLEHYLAHGWRQGYDPHPMFDTDFYIEQSQMALDTNPLQHFERVGRRDWAPIHPLFDVAAHPGARPAKGGARADHPIFAYLKRKEPGWPAPSRLFSDTDYAARYPDVPQAGFVPLVHYVVFGWREGKKPHRDFDPKLFAKLAKLEPNVEPYGYFARHLMGRASRARRPARPKVSIIILNYNKSLMTAQAIFFLERNTDLSDVQIVVVDNGSRADEFETLCRYGQGLDIVRIGTNRGFGEGNNIGAERARGDLLVFLNNDCFVCENWLPPLLDAMADNPEVGAVGCKLLFPDGSLQEAGAFITSCGTAVQRGKHLDPRAEAFNNTDVVDYCSAAALLVRAKDFNAVLGFDLCWDPAFYEDSDLCLKLRSIGKKTIYAHRSAVVHLEHGTAADQTLDLRLHNIVAVNRLKFVTRWSASFARPAGDAAAWDHVTKPRRSRVGRLLGLYTPYPLTPGGGERYLLTIAVVLASDYDCVLFTPDRYSRNRLLTLGRDLGLDLDHVELALIEDAGSVGEIDLFIAMGNELFPPTRGLGTLNFFHCQFPFPMEASHYVNLWHKLGTYQGVFVNSAFTADCLERAAQRADVTLPPISLIAPPVPQKASAPREGDAARDAAGCVRILNVGRFARGAHCKRQDLMIDAFETFCKRAEGPLELHLAGALNDNPDDRVYLQELVDAARELPVTFHVNAGAGQMDELYRDADLYWHMTGAFDDINANPERFEHFGISIAEAMSAGAVPLALDAGGPAEIITNGENGVLVKDASDLVFRSLELLNNSSRRKRLGKAAQRRASDFAPEQFERHLRAMIDGAGADHRSAFKDAAQ